MTFSKNLSIERSSRGYVRVSVFGTNIDITIKMDDDVKELSAASENYARTLEPDSIWATEMKRIEAEALAQARDLYKKHRGK